MPKLCIITNYFDFYWHLNKHSIKQPLYRLTHRKIVLFETTIFIDHKKIVKRPLSVCFVIITKRENKHTPGFIVYLVNQYMYIYLSQAQFEIDFLRSFSAYYSDWIDHLAIIHFPYWNSFSVSLCLPFSCLYRFVILFRS